MASQMEYVIAIDEPVARVHECFTSREYWEALEKVHKENAPTDLTRFDSGHAGTDVVFSHSMARSDLPSIAAAVVPINKFSIDREQHFDPFDADTDSATGSYNVAVPGLPLKLGGSLVMGAAASGSEVTLITVCKVSVPLVGRKIEEMLLNGLRTLFDAERDFINEWIGDHR